MSALTELLNIFFDGAGNPAAAPATRDDLSRRNPDTRDADYSLDRDIAIARTKWPGVVLVPRSGGGTALRATLIGIRGGGSREPQEYVIEVRLGGYPSACPEAVVHKPKRSKLKHINTFADGRICVSHGGQYQSAWSAGSIPLGERNIVGFVTQVHAVLRGENHLSPAR